jgi:magnesium transporter
MIGFFRIVAWQHLHFTNYGEHYLLLGFTVWASLIGVGMFGTLAGSMLPFILRRLGFDPAGSSAPFVATLVDVTGLCIYFLVALVILRGPCYEWKVEVLVCIYPVLVASYLP